MLLDIPIVDYLLGWFCFPFQADKNSHKVKYIKMPRGKLDSAAISEFVK